PEPLHHVLILLLSDPLQHSSTFYDLTFIVIDDILLIERFDIGVQIFRAASRLITSLRISFHRESIGEFLQSLTLGMSLGARNKPMQSLFAQRIIISYELKKIKGEDIVETFVSAKKKIQYLSDMVKEEQIKFITLMEMG
ncbi:hypothetical protein ACJX0J_012902, partial [Zea mays]